MSQAERQDAKRFTDLGWLNRENYLLPDDYSRSQWSEQIGKRYIIERELTVGSDAQFIDQSMVALLENPLNSSPLREYSERSSVAGLRISEATSLVGQFADGGLPPSTTFNEKIARESKAGFGHAIYARIDIAYPKQVIVDAFAKWLKDELGDHGLLKNITTEKLRAMSRKFFLAYWDLKLWMQWTGQKRTDEELAEVFEVTLGYRNATADRLVRDLKGYYKRYANWRFMVLLANSEAT